MNETHIIQFSDRTAKAIIDEGKNSILISLSFSKYGLMQADEYIEFTKWLAPLLEKYDSDKRPIVMHNPVTGEIATIGGDGSQAFYTICQSKKK